MNSTYEFKISGNYSGSGNQGFNNLTANITYSQTGVAHHPSYIVLAHELGHANDWLNYMKSNKKKDWTLKNYNEYRLQGTRNSESTAMQFENYIYLIYGGSYFLQRMNYPTLGTIFRNYENASLPTNGLTINKNSVTVEFKNHENNKGQLIFQEALIQYQKGDGLFYEKYMNIQGGGFHNFKEKRIKKPSKKKDKVTTKTYKA
jgi:hypothetical protein